MGFCGSGGFVGVSKISKATQLGATRPETLRGKWHSEKVSERETSERCICDRFSNTRGPLRGPLGGALKDPLRNPKTSLNLSGLLPHTPVAPLILLCPLSRKL